MSSDSIDIIDSVWIRTPTSAVARLEETNE
jgi:hypothetical protein